MAYHRLVAQGSTVAGEEFTFSVHVNAGAASVTATLAAWDTAIGLLWNGVATPADSVKQLYSTASSVVELSSTSLDPSTGRNVAQAKQSVSFVGTSGAASLPPNVATCVSLRTDTPTKAGRGRFFLPGMDFGAVSAGRLAATPQGQALAAAVGMLSSLSGAGFPVVILHRATMTATTVTSVDIGDVFDTITRRRDKL